jgi:hypothetical protein
MIIALLPQQVLFDILYPFVMCQFLWGTKLLFFVKHASSSLFWKQTNLNMIFFSYFDFSLGSGLYISLSITSLYGDITNVVILHVGGFVCTLLEIEFKTYQ